MITDIDAYFAKGCGRCDRFDTPACSALRWADGLARLRVICFDVGLEETVRWGHPCYRHADRNVAIIGAFRKTYRLSFFEAALLSDPNGLLEKSGPNTPHPDMISFDSVDRVTALELVIRAYLVEAMGYAVKGVRAPKSPDSYKVPQELVMVLDADPEMAEAFDALTPGRRKSYAIATGSAKSSKTRTRRALKYRSRILAGKGAMERSAIRLGAKDAVLHAFGALERCAATASRNENGPRMILGRFSSFQLFYRILSGSLKTMTS